MKRRTALAGLVPAVAAAAFGQRPGGRRPPPKGGPWGGRPESLPLGKTEAEKRILGVLDEAVKTGAVFSSVPASDGRMLRLLTEASGARNVTEIGTSTGYSGLWFCLALHKTGGRLTTFEIDAGRAAQARAHFKKAGVDGIVTLIEGDAHQNVKRLKDPIDVVFLDADKEGYSDYFTTLLPLVRPGGLITSHNVNMAEDYLQLVTSNPEFETLYYMEGGGLSITLKKR